MCVSYRSMEHRQRSVHKVHTRIQTHSTGEIERRRWLPVNIRHILALVSAIETGAIPEVSWRAVSPARGRGNHHCAQCPLQCCGDTDQAWQEPRGEGVQALCEKRPAVFGQVTSG